MASKPQQEQHGDGIVVVDDANVGGVVNIAQLGQREEKGSSDSLSASTVVVGEKQHELSSNLGPQKGPRKVVFLRFF